MIQITDHPGQIRARVTHALTNSGRTDGNVKIVAVSKQQPVEAIRRLFANGITDFGESYIDEALPKMDELSDLAITWHFIGRIQSNKTRHIAQRFDWVHSIDRARIARRLNDQRPHHAPPLNVLIQVNLLDEPQKGGIARSQVTDLARAIGLLPRLAFRGLMGIPPAASTDTECLSFYTALRELNDDLNAHGCGGDTLSMGMSGDFEIAVAAGSNCVRIGTALFGPRAA